MTFPNTRSVLETLSNIHDKPFCENRNENVQIRHPIKKCYEKPKKMFWQAIRLKKELVSCTCQDEPTTEKCPLMVIFQVLLFQAAVSTFSRSAIH